MAVPEVLSVREPMALARLDPQALIAQAIGAGAGIETMERLVALAERVQRITAKQAYDAAMAEFQRVCPPIFKTREAKIATRSGPGYRYTYAPLDEITTVVSPHMGAVGLSFRWRVPTPDEWKPDAGQIAQVCRITHAEGHYEESGVVAMPVERAPEGGSGANAMQRVGIAMTYSKRQSLLLAIGRAPEDDDQDGQEPRAEPREEPRDQHGTPPTGAAGERVISENQLKRFHAIARGQAWTEEQLHDLLTSYQLTSSKEITAGIYEGIVEHVKGSYDEWKAKKK